MCESVKMPNKVFTSVTENLYMSWIYHVNSDKTRNIAQSALHFELHPDVCFSRWESHLCHEAGVPQGETPLLVTAVTAITAREALKRGPMLKQTRPLGLNVAVGT